MRRKRSSPDTTPTDQFRAPIIGDNLIVREATRADARAIEQTMDAAQLQGGGRTSDGARRFGSALAEIPVWSATRAVCEKGTANIIGGVVITAVGDEVERTRRLGWWLDPAHRAHEDELLDVVVDRLRSTGTGLVLMHVRADAASATQAAERAGFRRGDPIMHAGHDGQPLEFSEYLLTLD